MKKKVNILFVMPSLVAGGAEKVMSFLAQNIDIEKFKIKLVVIGFEKDTAYDTSNVETIYLNKNHVRNAFYPLVKLINKEKPEIVFSSLSHLNTLMGLIAHFFPRIIFIGRETIVATAQRSFSNKSNAKTSVSNLLGNLGYKGLKYLISQSNDMKEDLINNHGFPQDKIVTINNPISKNFHVKMKIPEVTKGYQFITVGRLTKKKGHDRLLKVLSTLTEPFTYTIIGDGIEKKNIENLADSLNLASNIRYIPFTNKISEYLANSHVYLQGSFVEGFPNALIESLAVGTPAVVFDAPGGINEIIVSNENGYIASDEDSFSQKLNQLIKNINNFQPDKVSDFVRQKLNSDKIVAQYEDFFLSCVENNPL